MIFSQVDDAFCVTEDSTGPDPENFYDHSTDPTQIGNYDPVVLKVHYWFLVEDHDETDTDNPAYAGPTEYEALEGIATLNKTFNPLNIYFKYDKITVLNNSFLALQKNPKNSSCDPPTHTPYYTAASFLRNNSSDPNFVKPNVVNVYVMKSSVCFGGQKISSGKVSVSRHGMTGVKLVHEIGHMFNLNHTRHSENNYEGADRCEHVTRDPNDTDDPNDPYDTYFNALSKADRILDTNAVPDMSPNVSPYLYDEATCLYVGPHGDCQNTEYQIGLEDTKNTMGNSYACSEILFTTGQGLRMLQTITNATANNAYHELFDARSYDLTPLYEPYKGEYYVAGPVTDDNYVLFQPGFDYEFIECHGNCSHPDICDTDDTFTYTNNVISSIDKDEPNFNIITHPNHTAVRIVQLRDEHPARKCYNNFNFTPSGGMVTRFNDNIINTNITETPKDSIGINNPQLINTLQPGLYKIDKQFIDGSTIQTVIYKGNNN
ncbi:MAG: hypothetical protein ACPGU0_05985 [Marinirhabdus sp.]